MRRTLLILLLAVSASGFAFNSQLLSWCAPQHGPTRGDVLENSDIARDRMGQLCLGLALWANQYDGSLPEDPAVLYPDFVSDPLAFWHPGDTDPPPTTIDNSVPNAPNSARISFDIISDGSRWGSPDRVLIWDNTPANNGGLFVNMLTADGIIETDPPLATPVPTSTFLAQAHLRRLGVQMRVYLNDSYEEFPDDLIRLWEGRNVETPRSFWNPGDSDPLPTDITNSVPDAPDSAQVSFEYLASGLFESDVLPDTVLMRDLSPSNNGGCGINVLFGDGTVRFISVNAGCPDEDCDGKVTICHRPPGDPGKARTITVSVKASAAHLAHGDSCGPCP